MNRRFHAATLLVAGMLIVGCANDPDKFRNAPTANLCMAYLTLPSANIWQPVRAAELARRDEDCSRYAAAAAVKTRANAQHDAATEALLRQIPATTPQPRPATHTYIVNGRTVTCTTTGTVTNCF